LSVSDVFVLLCFAGDPLSFRLRGRRVFACWEALPGFFHQLQKQGSLYFGIDMYQGKENGRRKDDFSLI
jgi:hypothetical protein